MSDLVMRLCGLTNYEHDDLSIGEEAAAHIAALEAENERLREALKPFADEAATWSPDHSDDYIPRQAGSGPFQYTIGDLRRAMIAATKE